MTLSGEAKNEGGGQDIPGASSAMGGVSMEMSGGPCPDDYQGSQSPPSPCPASPSQASLALSALRKPGQSSSLHRGFGEAGQGD